MLSRPAEDCTEGEGILRIDSQQTACSHRIRRFVRNRRDPSEAPSARHAIRQVAALVVLAVLIVVGSTGATPPAFAMTPERTATNCSPGIPAKDCGPAEYVYHFAVSHNYAAPPGLKGNGQYRNENGLLPAGGDYREYRLYSSPGSSERLVIDRNSPEGNSWFTNDHYASFVQFYLTL